MLWMKNAVCESSKGVCELRRGNHTEEAQERTLRIFELEAAHSKVISRVRA